ncbi:hypothetical protein COV16_04880 [Candidatus Woesearchaeota archaeon CG10_big_fil_rev_8_21_14_0_10_34_8]|nr:MAG: hypothetical protein COV16_04880 [Candidatus Woesearchaeota archaeon CG10_big_fil_rev_8_21_14_0_10_34_8]
MKITIDTKEDSHEEIRKMILMLQHLVGDKSVFTNQDLRKEEPVSEQGVDAFGALFGDPSQIIQDTEQYPKEETKSPKIQIIDF